MALSIGELTGYLNLEDQGFTSGVSEAGNKLGLLGSTGGKVFAGLAAGAAAVAGTAVAFYKLGESVDGAYDTIAVGTGATGKELDGLRDDFKEVVKDVPTDFDTAGAAIADLNTMTGATGDTLQELSGSVLEASRMLGEDGTANAKAFGQALNQWQMDADEGADAMDHLFKVTQDYGIGLSDVTSHLNNYGSVLQNAGFSMSESAELFGQLEKSGLGVSRLMPGLNMAFRNWASEGKDARAELDNTVAAMQGAETETEALSIATEAFGAEGAQRLTTAVRSGSLELDELSKSLGQSEGSIEAAADETNSFGESWQRVKNNVLMRVEPVATKLFDAVSDGMEAVADNVGPAADRIGELWDSFAGGDEANGKLQQLRDFLEPLAPSVGRVLQAFEDLWAVVEPIATQVVETIRDNWGPLGEWVGETFGIIRDIVGLVLERLAANIEAVTSRIADFWGKWGDTILALATNAFQTVGGVIKGALKVIRGVVKTVTSLMQGDWKGAWNGIKDIVSGVWDVITSLVSGAVNQVRIVVAGAWNNVRDKTVSTWDGIVSTVRRKVDSVTSAVSGIKDKVVGFFSGAGSWLLDAGRKLIGGLVDGIKAMLPDVGGAMGAIADKAKGFLPGSPVKEGPLTSWNNGGAGKRLVGLLADGLRDTSPVDRAMQSLTGSMQLPDGLGEATANAGRGARGGREVVQRERIIEREGPLIGSVEQRPDEDAGEFADRLWFLTRKRG